MLQRMEPPDVQQLPFPLKLHNIIEKEPAYIHWSADGKTFQIFDNQEFVRAVLPRHFRTARMASFTRNLNIYGFRKLSKGRYAGCYYHPDFTRNGIDKIKGMKRYVNGTKPDFFFVESIDDKIDEPITSPEPSSSAAIPSPPATEPPSNIYRKRRRTPSHEVSMVQQDNSPPSHHDRPMKRDEPVHRDQPVKRDEGMRREEIIVTNLSQQLQPVQQQLPPRSDVEPVYPNHCHPADSCQVNYPGATPSTDGKKPGRPSLSNFGVPAAPWGNPRNGHHYGRRESLFEGQLPKRRASIADIFGCMDYATAIHRFHSDPQLDPLSPLGFTPHASGSMSPAVHAYIDQYYKALGTKDLYTPKMESPKEVPN